VQLGGSGLRRVQHVLLVLLRGKRLDTVSARVDALLLHGKASLLRLSTCGSGADLEGWATLLGLRGLEAFRSFFVTLWRCEHDVGATARGGHFRVL